MCTGLLAICICNHYHVISWTSWCASSCRFPLNHIQRVSFQCPHCDALDQHLLELEIAANTRVRDAARETNRSGAWAQKRSWMDHSETEREAFRCMLVAAQMEKERAIKEELERSVEREVKEWRVRVKDLWVEEEDWREEVEG